MVVSSLGYIFNCRYDCRGSLGIMENFKVEIRGTEHIVSLTCTVDTFGNILIPAYMDLSSGLRPISDLVISEDTLYDDIDKFVRSRKAYFGKLGDFAMIAVAQLHFDIDTGAFLPNNSSVVFYVPKVVSRGMENGTEFPTLICDRVSDSCGLNTFEINKPVLDAYKANFIKGISKESTESRCYFLASRLSSKVV